MKKSECPCTVKLKNSKVVVEQNKRKATFLNKERKSIFVTEVDGCLCRNEVAADFVVEKEGSGVIVVELKGRDVPHGVQQVEATAKYWVANRGASKVAGLVVCRQRPSYSTSVQRCQVRFARAYRAPLHVVPGNKEFDFDKMIIF